MKTHNQSVTLKFEQAFEQQVDQLKRIIGFVPIRHFAELIDYATFNESPTLSANPREPRDGQVTRDIQESLGRCPQFFPFMTRGVLLASAHVEELERRRFQISFEKPAFEGILDGGHNLLALGKYILSQLDEDIADEVDNLNTLRQQWLAHRSAIRPLLQDLEVLVPVELISPRDDSLDAGEEFENSVLEICQARNNNAELARAARANKAGHYDQLADSMEPGLKDKVAWKPNKEGARLRVEDIIALTWVPLLKFDFAQKLNQPRQIYNSKSSCVKAFDALIETDGVSRIIDGGRRQVIDNGVLSAFEMMADIPELYDLIYALLPESYNINSPGFGRIDAVRQQKENWPQKPKYFTKFYRKPVKYDYPDGYIIPLVYSLGELMELGKDNKLTWVVEPRRFLENNLKKVMATYISTIKMAGYDPQKVGKAVESYTIASMAMKFALMESQQQKAA